MYTNINMYIICMHIYTHTHTHIFSLVNWVKIAIGMHQREETDCYSSNNVGPWGVGGEGKTENLPTCVQYKSFYFTQVYIIKVVKYTE